MDAYDPALAARVWQRVRGQQEHQPPRQELLPLLADSWAAAAAYLSLARQVGPQAAATLRRLAREEQTTADALRGLHLLINGSRPALRTPPPLREAPEAGLRRRYTESLKAAAAYERLAGDPEYGPVFARLAQQEQEHCRQVLSVLGNWEK